MNSKYEDFEDLKIEGESSFISEVNNITETRFTSYLDNTNINNNNYNNEILTRQKTSNVKELFNQIPEDFSDKLCMISEKSKTENLRDFYFNFKLKDKNSPLTYSAYSEKLYYNTVKYCFDNDELNYNNYDDIITQNIDTCLSDCLKYSK